ncbi:MAG: TSUP family transporter, partial [Eubacterium sp.]
LFLVLLFSFTVKESAVYSVAIIFFSQLSQLVTIFINNRFEPYIQYYPIILVAMLVAVFGGIIGSKLNKKLSNKVITKVFSVTLAFVAVVNIYNAVTGFTA